MESRFVAGYIMNIITPQIYRMGRDTYILTVMLLHHNYASPKMTVQFLHACLLV